MIIAYTGVERTILPHGVVAMVGIAICVDAPSDFSMYFNSSIEIVGCFRGFSKISHNQNMNHVRPNIE